jgi:hypothetical protein
LKGTRASRPGDTDAVKEEPESVAWLAHSRAFLGGVVHVVIPDGAA